MKNVSVALEVPLSVYTDRMKKFRLTKCEFVIAAVSNPVQMTCIC